MAIQIIYNLQNQPTFHSDERLVNSVSGRECVIGLSTYNIIVYASKADNILYSTPCWSRTRSQVGSSNSAGGFTTITRILNEFIYPDVRVNALNYMEMFANFLNYREFVAQEFVQLCIPLIRAAIQERILYNRLSEFRERERKYYKLFYSLQGSPINSVFCRIDLNPGPLQCLCTMITIIWSAVTFLKTPNCLSLSFVPSL